MVAFARTLRGASICFSDKIPEGLLPTCAIAMETTLVKFTARNYLICLLEAQWLSKDIVLLVADGAAPEHSINAWLKSYHELHTAGTATRFAIAVMLRRVERCARGICAQRCNSGRASS